MTCNLPQLCMDYLVGFTPPCRKCCKLIYMCVCMCVCVPYNPTHCHQLCWFTSIGIENIMCTTKNCMHPCMSEFFNRVFQRTLHGVYKAHDTCISCDEAKCGPGFAACAGANRRRFVVCIIANFIHTYVYQNVHIEMYIKKGVYLIAWFYRCGLSSDIVRAEHEVCRIS